MPWGAIIIGIFLVGGAAVGLNHFVTGTAAIDTSIKTIVPWALAGIYGIVVTVSLFGGKS